MSVDLRGGEMRVPQQLLNAAKIRPVIQQVGRIAVSKLMRREPRIESNGL